MSLIDVVTKAGAGELIRHYYTDASNNKITTVELVVLKDKKLKVVEDNTCYSFQVEELCDDNWEIVNEI